MKHVVLSLVLATCVLSAPAIAQTQSRRNASPATTKATAKTSRSARGRSQAPPPSSGTHLGLERIGAAIGYISPENLDGTLGLGVFADLGHITPNVTIEPRIDFWSHSEGAFGAEASVRDVAVGARGKHFFPTASNLRPFAGAGLGLHFIHSEVTFPAFGGAPATTIEDSSTKLGLDIGGGVASTMSPRVDLLGELWYGIVSDVNQVSLRFGVSYRLGS